ncbi:MAG: hypothetical protein VB055_09720 [Oscillospiraceae bacterium]|nr:hypothetical protein [Oscillospiraceae bacterium]
METDKQVTELTRQEAQLIRLIRSIEFGAVHIIVRAHKPVRAEEIQRSIQL